MEGVERIYPVQYVRRFISWFKVLYNFRYTGGRRKPPSLPAGLFHCVSRISILRSLDLNRLTGELSGITVSRFINVVNSVSKCFPARVWAFYVYVCVCVRARVCVYGRTREEKKIGRFSSTRRENKLVSSCGEKIISQSCDTWCE